MQVVISARVSRWPQSLIASTIDGGEICFIGRVVDFDGRVEINENIILILRTVDLGKLKWNKVKSMKVKV